MGMINKLQRFFSDKQIRFSYLSKLGLLNWMSDKKHIEKKYELAGLGKIQWDAPKTFNEKMQWLKMNYHKDIFTLMADKYSVKRIVEEKIGAQYVIPLLGVWDNADEIDFNALPEQFVLKTTHDCGGVIVCKDKQILDVAKTRKWLNKRLKKNYYFTCREWPYKGIKPRIIAEQYIKDGDNAVLPVYKFLCFNGEPKVIQVIQNDKKVNETIDYFDINWEKLPFRQNFPNSPVSLCKPKNLDEMVSLARKLAEGMPFIRVDLYVAEDKIYFSEFTFYSDAGLAKFEPEEWDEKLGGWINLE